MSESPVCKVNAQLEPLLVPVADLFEDDANARSHSNRNLQTIATSYKEFGQQKPLVATKAGKVIAGNGQLAAARDILEWTHVACVKFDSEEEALEVAFAIADNRTAELAVWDETVLSEHLAALSASIDVEITGFNEAEVHAVMEGWGVAPLSTAQIPDHDEDGKHGLIKIEGVDLEKRDDVATKVADALTAAGYSYKVTAC